MHTPWVSFDCKDCSGCKHLNDRGYCEFTACIIPCTVSAIIPDSKPKTNADRFRAMTDEEMAEWFAGHDAGLIANVLNNDYVEPTKDGWIEWLKQESGES